MVAILRFFATGSVVSTYLSQKVVFRVEMQRGYCAGGSEPGVDIGFIGNALTHVHFQLVVNEAAVVRLHYIGF